MRIYDSDADKKVDNVILYLTPNEAQEMKCSLEALINSDQKDAHEHIPDRKEDYKREITICIYTEDNLLNFDKRSRDLILNDE